MNIKKKKEDEKLFPRETLFPCQILYYSSETYPPSVKGWLSFSKQLCTTQDTPSLSLSLSLSMGA